MNGITDAQLVAALRRHMTVATARQVAATGNLANFDTPGYKAKEVTFDESLVQQLDTSNATFSTKNGPHIASSAGIAVREAQGLPARRDGNTVQLDHELLTMSQAAGDFSAAQTALAAKFRLVRYAINEGK